MFFLPQVFHPSSAQPIFFVANRGHHADIGGATPGSMPPGSQSIYEEGAIFKGFRLVNRGEFQEEGEATFERTVGSLFGFEYEMEFSFTTWKVTSCHLILIPS